MEKNQVWARFLDTTSDGGPRRPQRTLRSPFQGLGGPLWAGPERQKRTFSALFRPPRAHARRRSQPGIRAETATDRGRLSSVALASEAHDEALAARAFLLFGIFYNCPRM